MSTRKKPLDHIWPMVDLTNGWKNLGQTWRFSRFRKSQQVELWVWFLYYFYFEHVRVKTHVLFVCVLYDPLIQGDVFFKSKNIGKDKNLWFKIYWLKFKKYPFLTFSEKKNFSRYYTGDTNVEELMLFGNIMNSYLISRKNIVIIFNVKGGHFKFYNFGLFSEISIFYF